MSGIGHDFTKRLLADAGLVEGQRVLDIGCGRGDISVLAAECVGSDGHVVGVDTDAGALEIAVARTQAMGLSNVQFTQGDLMASSLDLGLFDAIVGRRVMMYVPDAIAALRAVSLRLRSGGLVILHEHDSTITPASLEPLPLHATAQNWLKKMLEAEGADTHMGFNLHGTLSQAGLRVEHVRAEALVQTPDAPYPLASIIRAVLPRLLALGVASAQEIEIDTLDQRLAAEREKSSATYIADMMFGAWARKP